MTHRRSRGANQGFSMVEALIGVFLSALLVLTVAAVYKSYQRTVMVQEDAVEIQQIGRGAVAKIKNDLALAGRNVATNDGQPIIIFASPWEFVFNADIDNDIGNLNATGQGGTVYFSCPSLSESVGCGMSYTPAQNYNNGAETIHYYTAPPGALGAGTPAAGGAHNCNNAPDERDYSSATVDRIIRRRVNTALTTDGGCARAANDEMVGFGARYDNGSQSYAGSTSDNATTQTNRVMPLFSYWGDFDFDPTTPDTLWGSTYIGGTTTVMCGSNGNTDSQLSDKEIAALQNSTCQWKQLGGSASAYVVPNGAICMISGNATTCSNLETTTTGDVNRNGRIDTSVLDGAIHRVEISITTIAQNADKNYSHPRASGFRYREALVHTAVEPRNLKRSYELGCGAAPLDPRTVQNTVQQCSNLVKVSWTGSCDDGLLQTGCGTGFVSANDVLWYEVQRKLASSNSCGDSTGYDLYSIEPATGATSYTFEVTDSPRDPATGSYYYQCFRVAAVDCTSKSQFVAPGAPQQPSSNPLNAIPTNIYAWDTPCYTAGDGPNGYGSISVQWDNPYGSNEPSGWQYWIYRSEINPTPFGPVSEYPIAKIDPNALATTGDLDTSCAGSLTGIDAHKACIYRSGAINPFYSLGGATRTTYVWRDQADSPGRMPATNGPQNGKYWDTDAGGYVERRYHYVVRSYYNLANTECLSGPGHLISKCAAYNSYDDHREVQSLSNLNTTANYSTNLSPPEITQAYDASFVLAPGGSDPLYYGIWRRPRIFVGWNASLDQFCTNTDAIKPNYYYIYRSINGNNQEADLVASTGGVYGGFCWDKYPDHTTGAFTQVVVFPATPAVTDQTTYSWIDDGWAYNETYTTSGCTWAANPTDPNCDPVDWPITGFPTTAQPRTPRYLEITSGKRTLMTRKADWPAGAGGYNEAVLITGVQQDNATPAPGEPPYSANTPMYDYMVGAVYESGTAPSSIDTAPFSFRGVGASCIKNVAYQCDATCYASVSGTPAWQELSAYLDREVSVAGDDSIEVSFTLTGLPTGLPGTARIDLEAREDLQANDADWKVVHANIGCTVVSGNWSCTGIHQAVNYVAGVAYDYSAVVRCPNASGDYTSDCRLRIPLAVGVVAAVPNTPGIVYGMSGTTKLALPTGWTGYSIDFASDAYKPGTDCATTGMGQGLVRFYIMDRMIQPDNLRSQTVNQAISFIVKRYRKDPTAAWPTNFNTGCSGGPCPTDGMYLLSPAAVSEYTNGSGLTCANTTGTGASGSYCYGSVNIGGHTYVYDNFSSVGSTPYFGEYLTTSGAPANPSPRAWRFQEYLDPNYHYKYIVQTVINRSQSPYAECGWKVDRASATGGRFCGDGNLDDPADLTTPTNPVYKLSFTFGDDYSCYPAVAAGSWTRQNFTGLSDTPTAIGQRWGNSTTSSWTNYQWTPQKWNGSAWVDDADYPSNTVRTCPSGGCNWLDWTGSNPWRTDYKPAYYWVGGDSTIWYIKGFALSDTSGLKFNMLRGDLYDFLVTDFVRKPGIQYFWWYPYWYSSFLWSYPSWFWDAYAHSGCPWNGCGGWNIAQYNPPGWDFHPAMCRQSRVFFPQCVTSGSSDGITGNFCDTKGIRGYSDESICDPVFFDGWWFSDHACWCPPVFAGDYCASGANNIHVGCLADIETLGKRGFLWSNFNTCQPSGASNNQLYDNFLFHWHWKNNDSDRRLVLMIKATPNGSDWTNFANGYASAYWLEQDNRPTNTVGYRMYATRWPGWDPNTQKTTCYDYDQNGACDGGMDTYDRWWWANQLLVCKKESDSSMYAYWWSEPDSAEGGAGNANAMMRDFQKPTTGALGRSGGMYAVNTPPVLAYHSGSLGPYNQTRNTWHRYVPKIWPLRISGTCGSSPWGGTSCYDSTGASGDVPIFGTGGWWNHQGRIGFWTDPYADPFLHETGYTRLRIHRYCGQCPPTELANRNWNYGGWKAASKSPGTDTPWPEGNLDPDKYDEYDAAWGQQRMERTDEVQYRVLMSKDPNARRRMVANSRDAHSTNPFGLVSATARSNPFEAYLSNSFGELRRPAPVEADPFNMNTYALGQQWDAGAGGREFSRVPPPPSSSFFSSWSLPSALAQPGYLPGIVGPDEASRPAPGAEMWRAPSGRVVYSPKSKARAKPFYPGVELKKGLPADPPGYQPGVPPSQQQAPQYIQYPGGQMVPANSAAPSPQQNK